MNRIKLTLIFVFLICIKSVTGQSYDWQQFVTYDMNVSLDVKTHQMVGDQVLVYHNNSPDTLKNLYYHLYFNAFQPNSMMDVNSRQISDPDGRVRDRIYHLAEDEIGYQKINWLKQDGDDVSYFVSETVLVVKLNHPLLPGDSTTMSMHFESQVPLQIRRSGRDNLEGIAYSMAQWYPRIAGYDREGWATSPYVGREFHGTFGDFNVKITIDSSFTIGSTGYLQNPQQIGKGYEQPGSIVERPNSDKLTWHFFAPNVIDFTWGADDNYTHEIHQVPNGPTIHLLYIDRPQTRAWKQLGDYTVRAVQYLNDYIGPYAYEQFSVVQGADGGMEYPMMTLITGHRNLRSLVGVTVHELLHMWFQSTLATNESRYHYMDEGFTVYMSNLTMRHLFDESDNGLFAQYRDYISYLSVVNDGLEEPMITHADRFNTNRAYSVASYRKGAILMEQLGYIIGDDALKRTIQRYYSEWKLRHPGPTEFRRVAEQESGLILDWYFDQMINTTHTIDYALTKARTTDGLQSFQLERKGKAIMPIDLHVEYEDGTFELFYIPQQLMLGTKPEESNIYGNTRRTILPAWRWTDAVYTFEIYRPEKRIAKATIDPTYRLADVNRLNNSRPFPLEVTYAQPLSSSWDYYSLTWRPALWFGEITGLHAGLSAQGSYLFNNNRLNASLLLTSGKVDDYSVSRTDVDYLLSYEHKLTNFGVATTVKGVARRYYGIGEESLTFKKYLGSLGIRETLSRVVSLKLFHQYASVERNIAILQNDWDTKPVLGMQLSYSVGDPGANGIQADLVTGSQDRSTAAGYATISANHTYFWGINFKTRFGMSVGSGSRTMPSQWQWALSGPTGEQLWNNYAHWGIANINADATRNLNIFANDGTGLIGYALPGVGSPDIAGNNYFSGTVWNSWQPFAAHRTLKLLELELFSSIGKSWVGGFTSDIPNMSSTNPILASMGAGITFDAGSLPIFNRWKPQSRFLQDLQLSVRMPFFLNGLQSHDDWGARFIIGVSESF
jgi:hypothetical protein